VNTVNVMIVGGGGREHALAWAVSRSPRVDKVYAAPGNGGTASVGENVDVGADDLDALVAFARDHQVGLTVVGPEGPLIQGVVDRFQEAGLLCYGPRAEAARLEGSKVFAKEFMARHGIPTADFRVFSREDEARAHVSERGAPLVVKADGLAAGKGVFVAETHEEALGAIDAVMVERRFGAAGDRVVIEDRLEGEEVSVHAICAGGRALVLPSSQDHKRVGEGDRGPNTGGMGAYAPVPSFTEREMAAVRERIVEPTLEGLAADGISYSGTLYAGLMRTADGPKVLEFNVRFGDPETQVIVPLVKSDLFELLYAAAVGGPLDDDALEVHRGRSAATVVMAASGYPGSYEKGNAITGLDVIADERVVPFHAGTAKTADGLVTSGGRVLAVSAWNDDIRGALDAAYRGVRAIRFDGAFWRGDIGHRAL
jgi:phosphoribosylamine--glycine ligase